MVSLPARELVAPLVSVVMPSYQQVRFLEEAARSVLDQAGVAVELIVMDPGSTDGSRELLLRLQAEYGENLRLVFEPDAGQSDAINKGLALARGEILCWLNSDDRLRPGTLARVAPFLRKGEPAWLYGQAGIIDADGRPLFGFIAAYKNWRGRRFSIYKLLTEDFIAQMSVFWNRSMQERAGGLDVQRHLDMDYDLWLRFARVAEPAVLPVDLSDFRVHGEAKGSQRTGAQLDAALQTAREHAARLGWRGSLAILIHRLLSWRTRLIYRVIKP